MIHDRCLTLSLRLPVDIERIPSVVRFPGPRSVSVKDIVRRKIHHRDIQGFAHSCNICRSSGIDFPDEFLALLCLVDRSPGCAVDDRIHAGFGNRLLHGFFIRDVHRNIGHARYGASVRRTAVLRSQIAPDSFHSAPVELIHHIVSELSCHTRYQYLHPVYRLSSVSFQWKILRHHRQIRVVIRIAVPQDLRPAFPEFRHLILEPSYLFRRVFQAAGPWLVMIQLCIRIINDQIAGLPEFHAQIDVVEGNSQLLRKSSDLVKSFPLHHHARCRHGAVILLADHPVHIAGLSAFLIDKCVPGDAAPSDHDSGMLNRIVLIVQPGSCCRRIRPHCISQQLFHHIRRNEFRIVVQKKQVFAVRLLRPEIVDGGIVEASFVALDPDAAVCFQFFIIAESLLFRAVVLNDYDIIIRILRFLPDRVQAAFKVPDMIFIRN